MLKVSLHSLPGRIWQLVWCLGAVIVGISATSAALSLSASVRTTTNDVVAATVADVNVLPDGALVATDAVPAPLLLEDSHVQAIAELPGVLAARGIVRGTDLFPVTSEGRVMASQLAPTVTGSYHDAVGHADLPGLAIGEGAAPEAPGEVVVDRATLERGGHEIGDEVTFARPGPHEAVSAEVVGVVTLGADATAGASFALFADAGARDVFLGGQEGWNGVWVELDPDADVPDDEVVTAIRGSLPAEYTTVRGGDLVDATRFQLHPRLTIAQVALWVTAGLALGVAAALISTTTSSLISRRQPEAAFLRRLGASRPRIVLPILLEAVVVGLLGSLLALPLGQALARALAGIGLEHGLSPGGTVAPLSTAEQWACIGLGVVLTVLSAQRHATAASFTRPLLGRPTLPRPRLRSSDAAWTSVGLVAVGIGLLVAVAVVPDMPAPSAWAVVGAVVLLIGTVIAAPVLGAPAVHLLGLAGRPLLRDVSTLAARNVVRHPTRFARSAAALVLGTGLVATLAVLGASGRVSAHHDVPANLSGDLFVTSAVPGGFSRGVAGLAAELPEVESVGSYGIQRAVHDGDPRRVMVADPEVLPEVLALEVVEGRSPRTVDEVLVEAGYATDRDIARGNGVTLRINGDDAEVRVVGVFQAGRGIDAADFVALREAFTDRGVPDVDTLVAITLASPSDSGPVQRALAGATEADPLVRVQTPAGLADSRGEALAAAADTAGALLWFLVVVSVIGITGTLLLALHERRREFRALRLVGMERLQVTGMIALEAFLTGTVGGLLGTAAGTVTGWGLQQAFADRGYPLLDIPWPSLVGHVGIGILAGVVSAVLPSLLSLRTPALVAGPRTARATPLPEGAPAEAV